MISDTHPVPMLGLHSNPAGEKRTLMRTYPHRPSSHNTYTALVYLDHTRNVVREGSPAEWARWAAKKGGTQ